MLADAMSLADEEAPDTHAGVRDPHGRGTHGTGPGSRRPCSPTTKQLRGELVLATAKSVGDPVWRLPFWPGYERNLDSEIADMNNVSDGPFAGAITAALFLRRFVDPRTTICPF